MNKSILMLVFGLLIVSFPAHALEVAGVKVDDTTLAGDGKTQLLLNGAGLREKFFIDVYVGSLYLQAKTPDVNAILSDDGPARVQLDIVYSKISKEKITQGWLDGLEDNLSSSEFDAIQSKIKAFNKLFTPLVEGDVIRIDYTPENGTELRINGEWRGDISGNDFFRDLLKIWLGPDPVSDSLKQGMLGK